MSAESIKLLHDKMDLIKEQVRTLRKALSATNSSGDNTSVDDLDSKNNCLSILSELAYSFQEIDQVFDACSFMGPARIADMKTQVEYCLNVVRNLSMETISPAPIILESWFRNIDLMDEILARIAEIVIGGDDGMGMKSADELPKIDGAMDESTQEDARESVKSIEETLGPEKVGSAETPAAHKPEHGAGISDKGGDLAVPATDKSSAEIRKQPVGGEENKIEPGIQPTPSGPEDAKQSSAELYAARFARFGPVSYGPTNKTPLSSDKKSNSEAASDHNTVPQPPDADGAVKELKSAEPAESQSLRPDKVLPDQGILKDPSREAGTPDVSEVTGAHAMKSEAVKPGLPPAAKVSPESVEIPKENAVPLKPNGDSIERHSPTAGRDNANPPGTQGVEGSAYHVEEPPLSQKDERAIEETVRKANEFIGAPAASPDPGLVPSEKPVITVTDRLSLIHEALEKLINARIAEKAEEAKHRDEEAQLVTPVREDKNDEERKRAEKEAFLEAIRKQEDIRREEFSQTLMKEVTSLHTELSGKIKELESQIGHLSDKEQRVEAKLETQYREQIDILESRLQRLKDEMASEKLKSGILDERKVLEIIEEREHVNQLRVAAPPPMEEAPLKTGGDPTPAPENDSRVLGDHTETTADAKRPSVSVWGIVVRAVRFFLLSFLVAICIVGGSWFVLERVLFKEPKPMASTASKTDVIPERKSSAAFNAFADSNPVSLEKRGLRLIVLQLRDNPRASGRVQIANMLRGFRWKGVPDVLLETAKNDPDPRVAAEAFAGFKDITKYPGVADANYAAVDIWWGKNKAEIDAKLEDAS
jgi:hypothetical protein